MAKTTIRSYAPPPIPPSSGSPEGRLKALEAWAERMQKWAQDSQAALLDFIQRAGL